MKQTAEGLPSHEAEQYSLALTKNEPANESDESPVQSRRARPPRIVVVNNGPGPLARIDRMIRRRLKDSVILLFGDSNEAWQELSRTDPDLLITADFPPRLRGREIIRQLLDRKVEYPIIVMSLFSRTDDWVLELGRQGFNIALLKLPCMPEDFRKALEVGLRIKIQGDPT